MVNMSISVICAGVFFIAAMVWGVIANFGSTNNKTLWDTALSQGMKNGAAGLFLLIFGCIHGDNVIALALILGAMSIFSAVVTARKKLTKER